MRACAQEKNADPEFMEAAIDYAEAYRGFKDLVKLAKLTKETVVVSTKEKGQPRQQVSMTYADAPGSNLAPTKEYAERAVNEVRLAGLRLHLHLHLARHTLREGAPCSRARCSLSCAAHSQLLGASLALDAAIGFMAPPK